MKKFEDIINKILKELEYEDAKLVLEREEISSWGYINENMENTQYYVVSVCKSQYLQSVDFEGLQEEVYKGMKGLFAEEPAVEKNTSWLIGVECESNYENLMGKILEIEENPYYFKKMVCPYLQTEVNACFSEIGTYTNYIGYMQQEITNVNRFVNFHEGKDNVYNFLSRIVIKIPSINLPIEKKKEIKILSDDIEKSIQEDDLQKIYRFLKENIDEKINMIDDNINDLHDLYYGKDTENE